jgi:2-methylcitrate dehydratase PrpD
VRIQGEAAGHGIGTRLTLRSDANTAYAWSAGLAGGTAVSLDDLAQRGQMVAGSQVLASVTFENAQVSDGSFRLESVRTGANSR